MLRHFLRISLVVGLGVVSVASADCSALTCTTSGAHIIVSRESGAPAGTSAMNIIALGVTSQCAGSDIAQVPYPATIDAYSASEQEGVGNLTELVLEYQDCCPESRIVLLGYSQVLMATRDSPRASKVGKSTLTGKSFAGRPSHLGLPLRHDRDRPPYHRGICGQCYCQQWVFSPTVDQKKRRRKKGGCLLTLGSAWSCFYRSIRRPKFRHRPVVGPRDCQQHQLLPTSGQHGL